jgi:hypothetical protein
MTIRVRPRLIPLVALLTVAVGAGAAWTYEAASRSVHVTQSTLPVGPGPNIANGVDQAALAKCISQSPPVNCETVVPGLAECMAQELVCNQAADVQSKSTTDFGTPMTRAEAISAAGPFSTAHLDEWCKGDGWKVLADTNGSAFKNQADCISSVINSGRHYVVARQMQYREYLALVDELPSPFISLARIVWVVTVHSPVWTDGSPMSRPRLKQAYTVVYAAASRQVIEMCIGCATLSAESRKDAS